MESTELIRCEIMTAVVLKYRFRLLSTHIFWYYFQLLAHCAVSSTRGELAKINEVDEEELELKYSESVTESSISGHGRTRCRYSVSGCPFKLPSMQQHEDRECSYRPTRCPSLTCTAKAPFVKLLKHITVIIIQFKIISIIVYIRTYISYLLILEYISQL